MVCHEIMSMVEELHKKVNMEIANCLVLFFTCRNSLRGFASSEVYPLRGFDI